MTEHHPPLAGRVALVTGAGRGLGRAHALELATLGAAVLVNDLGVALDGSSADARVAETVVGEITDQGGRAVADATDVASVQGGRAVVQAAVRAFGRIDIVVNNAGISADGGLEQLDESVYDAQLAIHLKAAMGTTSEGFGHMRSQGWGRIINTVSEVALDARFDGAGAYGVAKAALWSFTLSAARAAAAHGITVNAISPGAATRMSQGVLGEAGGAAFRGGASRGLDLDPAHVSRVVGYLCTDEAADINGRVIHAAAGQVREYTTSRTSRSELVERISNYLPPVTS